MSLCLSRRGEQLEHNFLGGGGNSSSSSSSSSNSSSSDGSGGGRPADGYGGGDRVLLRYQLPLSELAGDFYSRLKTATHGCGVVGGGEEAGGSYFSYVFI